LWISGQLAKKDGGLLHKGKVGREVSLEQGKEAAAWCILNGLAWAKDSLGNLDKISKVIKVTGFVASAEGFTDQPLVINGASDLLIAIFGEDGKHARSAVGVFELPFGVSVEVEMVLEIKE